MCWEGPLAWSAPDYVRPPSTTPPSPEAEVPTGASGKHIWMLGWVRRAWQAPSGALYAECWAVA